MIGKICICPATWKRISLVLSRTKTGRKIIGAVTASNVRARFTKRKRKHRKSRKHRSAKQRAATRKLIAFNKRRRR